MELIDRIKLNAKKHNKRIVLPEGTEERTIQAADIAIEEGLAQIILIGNPTEINALAAKKGLKNIGKAKIVDPKSHEKKERYIELMLEIRKSKGLTREDASRLIEDPLYLGVLMIKNGDADGEVTGADHATGEGIGQHRRLQRHRKTQHQIAEDAVHQIPQGPRGSCTLSNVANI